MKGFDEKILFCKLSNRDMVKMTSTKNQMTMIPILMNWMISILMMMMILTFPPTELCHRRVIQICFHQTCTIFDICTQRWIFDQQSMLTTFILP